MRDYTVGGPEEKIAEAKGLVDADWYRPKVDRELMKKFMARNNSLAAMHIASWFAALGVFGYLAHLSWGSLWAVPAFAVYGVL